MTCISNLLGRVAPTVESQLKPKLVGFTGFLVRGYLPQRWVFETGQERASLIVDIDGNTEATLGVIESPDVLITTTHDTLSTAPRGRERVTFERLRDKRPNHAPVLYNKGRNCLQFSEEQVALVSFSIPCSLSGVRLLGPVGSQPFLLLLLDQAK